MATIIMKNSGKAAKEKECVIKEEKCVIYGLKRVTKVNPVPLKEFHRSNPC
jgi:hypothetical protein